MQIQSLKALDDFTLEIIYKQPYFKAIETWMVGILPYHILKDEKDLMTSSFNKNPIGTGSYKLKEFKQGQDIELIANDDYFEGKPAYLEAKFYASSIGSSSFTLTSISKSINLSPITGGRYDSKASNGIIKNWISPVIVGIMLLKRQSSQLFGQRSLGKGI